MEETFGFTNNNPKGIYPDLRGYVDDIEVAIDVQFHYYAGGGTSQRPWTRVRAQLPKTPPLQARSRHQKTSDRIDWPPRETGDPAFDQKYELFVPADTVLEEALTPALKEALMMADPPVHILNNVVLWTKVKTVKDPKLLERVVRSCVSVASAINN